MQLAYMLTNLFVDCMTMTVRLTVGWVGHLLTPSTCCRSLATIFTLSDACFMFYSDVKWRSDNLFN